MVRGHESDALVCAVFESARFHAEASVLADFAFGLRVAADVAGEAGAPRAAPGPLVHEEMSVMARRGRKSNFIC